VRLIYRLQQQQSRWQKQLIALFGTTNRFCERLSGSAAINGKYFPEDQKVRSLLPQSFQFNLTTRLYELGIAAVSSPQR
jgi:hypothetical protein